MSQSVTVRGQFSVQMLQIKTEESPPRWTISQSVTSTEQNGTLLLQIEMFEVLGGELSRSVTGSD